MRNSKENSARSYSYQRNLIKATVATNIGINNHDRLVKAYGSGASRIEILQKLKKQSRFTIWWFSIFIVLGLACLIIDPKGWFNVFDLFILMVNIYLVAKGKLIGIYIGTIECLLYAFICLKSQLYGEIIKTMCIAVPLNTYSIISWTININKRKKDRFAKKKKKDEEITVNKLSKKGYIIYFVIFAVCTAISYLLLKFIVGQKNALILSAITLAMTITGKILTAKRYMESYIVFNIGSFFCILMWAQTLIQTGFVLSDITMIVYHLACFTNDIYAYNLWKGMYRKVAVNGGVILAKRKVNIKKIIKLKRQFKNLYWDKELDMSKNS